ncbi:hypothetical protein [Wukongibacter sp. M2B1]|uniref:hypothetical protein n=1 Tax=Wukongibacter sp. M2B1 TaxID=3088895 RepID=UPI003D79CC82
MAGQRIEVEVNITNAERSEQEITKSLIDIIKLRLNKYPSSSQIIIYDLILSTNKVSDDA